MGGRTATVEVTDGTSGQTWKGITLGAQWILGSEQATRMAKRGSAYEYAALAGVPQGDYLESFIESLSVLAPDGQGRFLPDEKTVDLGLNGLFTPRGAVMEEYAMEARRNWKWVPGEGNPVSQNWDKAFELDAMRENHFSNTAQACLINSFQGTLSCGHGLGLGQFKSCELPSILL